jgi:hypothetical protein
MNMVADCYLQRQVVELKRTSYLIPGILIFIFLIPTIFYSCFTAGMISTNSSKVIKLDWVKQYKAIIKEEFSCINDVNIYYKQGRVNFDFNTSSKISLKECKQITRTTKEFIEKQATLSPLMDKGFDQLYIRLKFDIDKDSYVFDSAYWISSRAPNVNANLPENNNNETWNFNINGVLQERLEFK